MVTHMIQPCKLKMSTKSTQFNQFLAESMFKKALGIELGAKNAQADTTQLILRTSRENDEVAQTNYKHQCSSRVTPRGWVGEWVYFKYFNI